jgi:hypothetical protein
MPSVILAGTTTGTALSLTSDTSGELQIQTNNGSTTAMTLTTAGNVGVGTTTPTNQLDILTSGGGTAIIRSSNSALRFVSSGGENYIQSGTAATSSSPAPLIFSNVGGINETMRITSAGNVGIGLTSPAAKLDILSPDAVVGTSYLSKGLQFAPANFPTRTWSLNYDDGGSVGNGFNISSVSTKILYLNANGNVGVGTVNPNSQLNVSAAANAQFELTATSGGPFRHYLRTQGNDLQIRASSGVIQFYTGNADGLSSTERLSIPSDAAGITFPATQAASTNANTLDDYEEGTWTPSINTGNNNASVSINGATSWYVKVGRLVTFSTYINCNVISVGTGSLRVLGLPFTNTSTYSAITTTHDTLSGSTGQGYVQDGGTFMEFINANSTPSVVITGTGTKYIMITGSYVTT